MEENQAFDDLGRPSKMITMMQMAFIISQRSMDKSTKCGCVFVDDEHAVLSMGYNGPIRHFNDKLVPQTRPEKYLYFEHAERNAIYNAARTGICLGNSIIYITGFPCFDCLRAIIQVGTKEIIYGPNNARFFDVDSIDHYKIMIEKYNKIKVTRFPFDYILFENDLVPNQAKDKYNFQYSYDPKQEKV